MFIDYSITHYWQDYKNVLSIFSASAHVDCGFLQWSVKGKKIVFNRIANSCYNDRALKKILGIRGYVVCLGGDEKNMINENTWIELQDGRRLAARLWLPDSAQKNPAPAILEYLPYRLRDGTAERDENNYPSFAAAGYAGVRVDIAGNGDSDGYMADEYLEDELASGEEVIEWIAAQPWC